MREAKNSSFFYEISSLEITTLYGFVNCLYTFDTALSNKSDLFKNGNAFETEN